MRFERTNSKVLVIESDPLFDGIEERVSAVSKPSTNLMNAVPFTPPPSTKPLKILSFKMLPY